MNGFRLGAPGPEVLIALGGTGVLLIVLALAVLAWADRRRRWLALFLGLIGILFAESALENVRTQTVRRTVKADRSMALPRYPFVLRSCAIPGMIALPLLFAAASASLWTSRNRRQHEEACEHYKDGVHHYYQSNYEAALIELSAGLKNEPHRADLLCMRGAVFARLGAHEMALADLDRALTHAPAMLDAYLQRGRVRAARGEYDLALADFDRVLTARHNDAECLLERGFCLERKGLVPDAIAVFERILRLTNQPDFASPATERLRALGASGPAWPQAAPSTP